MQDAGPKLDAWFARTATRPVGCLLILCMGSFAKVLNFGEIASLSHFPSVDAAPGVSLWTLCLTLDAKGFISSYKFYNFTFKSMICDLGRGCFSVKGMSLWAPMWVLWKHPSQGGGIYPRLHEGYLAAFAYQPLPISLRLHGCGGTPFFWCLVRSVGREDPLEEGMATHSCTLAWDFPRTEEPGGLQSMGSERVGHDWRTNIFLEEEANITF